MSESAITAWIRQLREGDSGAAQPLWELYFQRMVQLARKRLEGAAKGAADEEDVALSAFKSFCLGAREGRYPQLLDSDGLWPLLMAITAHKSVDLIRRNNRVKRGGEKKSSAPQADSTPRRKQIREESLSGIISQEPTPEFAAALADQVQRLFLELDETGDLDLRRIALLKMDGYSNVEIAEQVGCVRRSVERKLQVITRLWEKDAES